MTSVDPTPTLPDTDPPIDKPTDTAPEPVLKAAGLWGTLATVIVAVLGMLVALGVLSSEQADAVQYAVTTISTNIVPVGVSIVGVVGLVSGIVAHLVTAFAARGKVTPVTDPRDGEGRRLVAVGRR